MRTVPQGRPPPRRARPISPEAAIMSEKECTYFRTLYGVAKVINSSLEPAIVLQGIVEQTAKAAQTAAAA